MKSRRWIYWMGGVLAFGLLVLLAWAGVDTTLDKTADAGYCGSCHVMEALVNSYHDSVHGGRNAVGFQAKCVDCHLSHENSLAEFASKTKLGVVDLWTAATRDEFALDWQALREEHNDYVFDSGCLQCHSDLAAIPNGRGAHANYMDGVIDSQCVDCHEGVGHENLNRYLLQGRYRYSDK